MVLKTKEEKRKEGEGERGKEKEGERGGGGGGVLVNIRYQRMAAGIPRWGTKDPPAPATPCGAAFGL